jgi:hypothetical protein
MEGSVEDDVRRRRNFFGVSIGDGTQVLRLKAGDSRAETTARVTDDSQSTQSKPVMARKGNS